MRQFQDTPKINQKKNHQVPSVNLTPRAMKNGITLHVDIFFCLNKTGNEYIKLLPLETVVHKPSGFLATN